MITARRSDQRGHFDHGWLDTWHTFSFGDYVDPAHRGFRVLRVINEDTIRPGAAFAAHPHRNMEIITYVVSGQLEHQDSTGVSEIISAGQAQAMSAGTGIVHSEANPSADVPVHLLQIWIRPKTRGVEPRHAMRTIWSDSTERGRRVIASGMRGSEGLSICQDATVHAVRAEAGETAAFPLGPDRHAWLQVVRGEVGAVGERFYSGDGASVSEFGQLDIFCHQAAEFLVFDLP